MFRFPKRSIRQRLYSVSNSTVAAFVVSVFAGSYSYVFGTDDFEESRIVGWSAGLRHEWFFEDRGPRTTGLGTFLGVPVYDALQGTGNRLPYQASWAQLPFWFLRYVLFWKEFVAFHFLVATFCAMVLCLRALRSWIPELSFWRMILIGFVLLSPLGLNTRQNDWPSWYLTSIALTGLSTALLMRRDGSLGRTDLEANLSFSKIFHVGICCIFIATSSPSTFPVVAACLLPLILSSGFFEKIRLLLRQETQISAHYLLSGILIGLVTCVSLASVGVDLLKESSHGPGLSTSRAQRSQGFTADQVFVGVSDAVMVRLGLDGQQFQDFRRIVERAASLGVSSVAIPVFRLFRYALPESTVIDRIGGSFPRGEFTAALVLIAAGFVGIRRRIRSDCRRLIKQVLVCQTTLLSFGVLVASDVLPGFLQPSSAWQLASPALAISVFLTGVLLWRKDTRAHSIVRVLCQANFLLAATWTALQLSFLSASPSAEIQLPERRWPLRENQLALNFLLSEFRGEKSRVAFVVREVDGEIAPQVLESVFVVSLLHQPVVSPTATKIRENGHMTTGLTLDSGIAPISLATWHNSRDLTRLLSFLQVRDVVMPYGDDPSTSSSSTLNGRFSEMQLVEDGNLVTKNLSLRLAKNQEFSIFSISNSQSYTIKKCPLLTQSCELLEHLVPISVSRTPQIRVCLRRCLWTVEVPATTGGSKYVVLPVKFDSSLRMFDSTIKLATFDYGGFLGVKLPAVSYERVLVIDYALHPISLMRVTSSYLNSVVVVVAVIAGLFKRVRRI